MEEPAKLLVVFTTESECWGEAPLFEAIVRKLCSLGIEGSTASSARMGFGRSRRVHTHSAIGIDEDRPIVVTAADSEPKLREAIPHLRALAPRNRMLLLDAEIVPIGPAAGARSKVSSDWLMAISTR